MPDTVMTGPIDGQKLTYSNLEIAPSVAGRRAFFTYHDLGVKDGSNGALSAQIMKSKQGLGEPTGWHYHACEGQFIYIIKGWVDLEFENGEKKRINEGDSLFIPGGMRHNETATADDLEILEILVPSEMVTVPTDPPAGMSS